MSVNLKGRKNAQSEPVPAPELVMAGGQTPWANDQPPAGNPFAETSAPDGMPTMPPPPPPFAPGEEADAEAPSGRKAPSRKVLAIAAAVVILLGGGYYYTTTTGSSSGSTSNTAAATLAANKAKIAALRAKAAAGKPTAGAAAATGASAAKPGAGKPVVATKPVTPAKGAAKPAVKPVTNGAKPVAATVAFHAALPGRIGLWSKLASAKLPPSLAKYDADLGTSPSNVQEGLFGGTADEPNLYVITGDHTPKAGKSALQIVDLLAKDIRADAAAAVAKTGLPLSNPVVYPGAKAVPHTPWGGTAACTTIAINDSTEVLCAWMDANTFGILAVPHQVDSRHLELINMVRGSVEH